jgi:DNA polymerase III subunit gamma/tau
MYLSLYRKWRPMDFDDVLGQDDTVQVLKNTILLNRISHAYLFCGPRGTGKTSCARIFAKSLNCEKGPTPKPCQICPNCEQISKGNSLDILEIDAASNRGIENIRELRERVRLLPVQGKYKIYIIDEVHMLTGEAFNALLKTLEEPPSHTVFIMATTEPHKLPATIISRCQRFDFRRIPPSVIAEKLKKEAEDEKILIDERALTRIAEAAEGSMRDAESILDQLLSYSDKSLNEANVLSLLGRSNTKKLKEYLDCLIHQPYEDLFNFIETLMIDGIDLMQFSKDLIVFTRDLFVLQKTKGQSGTQLKMIPLDDIKEYGPFSLTIQENVLLGMMNMWGESLQNMRYLSDPDIFFELTAIKMKHKYDRALLTKNEPSLQAQSKSPETNPKLMPSQEWDDFLAFLKNKELMFFTTLCKGSPIYHEDSTIEIILPKESKFLASHLEKQDKLQNLEKLIEEFYGRCHKVKLSIGSPANTTNREETFQENEKKQVMQDPTIQEAVELFSADIQYIEKKGGN